MTDIIGNLDMQYKDLWVSRQEASKASDNELEKDELGFTNPNLHRRINNDGDIIPPELKPRQYNLSIYGYNSYRGIDITLHDEDSTDVEIP